MKDAFFHHLSSLIENPQNKRFLLTVSGGKDSTVLVHLFHSCQLDFDMAHCNFHLRGDDSERDMQFVQDLAKSIDRQLFIKEFDTFSAQKNSGLSLEMVARNLRYCWFDELAPDYDYVVTAHHADDNAETVLLNLARGTGLRGLTGIPALNGKYLRPLLPFSSDEILAYASQNHIAYRIDKSNYSETFHRNKIRQSVIPKLKEINPSLIDTFSQNIKNFKQLEIFYHHQLCKISAEICHIDDEQTFLSISKLSAMEDQEIILFELLRAYHFDGPTVHEIHKAMNAESGRIFYSSTHQLLKDRDFFIIKERKDSAKKWQKCNNFQELADCGFFLEKQENSGTTFSCSDKHTIYVAADKLQFPIEVRHWQEGDWFIPFGMKGRKKLSDLFTDLKIDRFSKQQVRVLCSKGEIVWVIGLRADNRFRIDENTIYYYKITYDGRI